MQCSGAQGIDVGLHGVLLQWSHKYHGKYSACSVQLTGMLLMPFVVEMETLFLTALFRPLNERLFISQLNVIQVCAELCFH